MKVLVTGAGGLIGSESVKFYLNKGAEVIGIDNNMRKYFFGDDGDISQNLNSLKNKNFKNYKLDARNRDRVENFFKKKGPFNILINTLAQCSHDWSYKEPYTDHDTNDNATFNILESYRKFSPDASFIHYSTSKAYGDRPNKVNILELPTRYDYAPEQTMVGVSEQGITEEFSIDNSIHSLFGVSKLAGDLAAQEYGKNFGLNVGIFRGDCLTGHQHAAVELHGFLAYLVHCAKTGKPYKVFGYERKQVRGNIHAIDCVLANAEFIEHPRPGEVYNLGGGKENSISMMEAMDLLENKYDLKLNWTYEEKPRRGDHICFYSDISKLKRDFPKFKITMPINKIMDDLVEQKT